MTESDKKVVKLVVDKPATTQRQDDFGISMGAQIKYVDEEVAVVKTVVTVNGVPFTHHILVENPKK